MFTAQRTSIIAALLSTQQHLLRRVFQQLVRHGKSNMQFQSPRLRKRKPGQLAGEMGGLAEAEGKEEEAGASP